MMICFEPDRCQPGFSEPWYRAGRSGGASHGSRYTGRTASRSGAPRLSTEVFACGGGRIVAIHQFSEAATAPLDRFLTEINPPSPCIVVDLDVVRARYRTLRQALPEAEIYYAVKANPAAEVVSALAALGANFDLASPGELDICLGLNIAPQRLSFGNTIKRESAIARASAAGLGLFAFDSAPELEKLARSAPAARVFCRLLIENKGAEWPLTRKFGCESHMAVELLAAARQLGLRPAGVSFHVGSQQTYPQAWSDAIAHAAWVFRCVLASRARPPIDQPWRWAAGTLSSAGATAHRIHRGN